MGVTLAIAVGSVLLVVCGFTWAARREELVTVARLKALTPTALDDATAGALCATRGKVVGPDAVDDPVTKEPAVFFEARLERRDRGEELWADRAGEALRLDDGSQRKALVELVGAEIAIAPEAVERADRAPSARMAALLADAERDVPDETAGARYVLEHRAVRVGDELTLVGVPRERDGALVFTSADPLYLSPEPLEDLQARLGEDLRAMDAMLKIGLAIGVALVVGGALAVLLLG